MPEYPQPGGVQLSQTKWLVFDKFAKMNTQADRVGLPDEQLAWLENLMPIAENKLQAVPAAAGALANVSGTITLMFYATIEGVDYFIIFTDDGAGWFCNLSAEPFPDTGQFAPPGTFSPSPDVTQWEGDLILINDAQAGYCGWNGNVFVQQGGVSMRIIVTAGGADYGSPPSVSIDGGQGGGSTAHAVIEGGQVVDVVLDSPGGGYEAGDVLTVNFGSGSGSGATFTRTMATTTIAQIGITGIGQWAPGNGPAQGNYGLITSGGGGSAGGGFATVAFNAATGYFYVASTTLLNAGSGYTSAPSITWDQGAHPITASIIPTFQALMNPRPVATVTRTAGGSGYPLSTTVPLIFSGGGTPEATGHAVTNGSGVITSAVLDSGGSYPAFNVPSVTAAAGSGAAATAVVWPFVPGGTTLAVFQGRVWLGGGVLLQWSGVNGFDDFDPNNGSGALNIVDPDLVHAITALRALNNYLWIVGDQSVKQIGNITLNLDNVTLFNILTLSSDQGSLWPKTCISFNRIFMFANTNGIYGVFGSTVQKISDDLDGIFRLLDLDVLPQGAVVDLYAKHQAVFLVRYEDPDDNLNTRTLLLMFDGKKWWVANQSDDMVAIVTFPEFSAAQNVLFASLAGTDVSNCFGDDDTPVPILVKTALSHGGDPVQGKRLVRAGFTAGWYNNFQTTLNMGMATEITPRPTPNVFQLETVSAPPESAELHGGSIDAQHNPVTASGVYLGATISGTMNPGFTLKNIILEYQATQLWRKAQP